MLKDLYTHCSAPAYSPLITIGLANSVLPAFPPHSQLCIVHRPCIVYMLCALCTFCVQGLIDVLPRPLPFLKNTCNRKKITFGDYKLELWRLWRQFIRFGDCSLRLETINYIAQLFHVFKLKCSFSIKDLLFCLQQDFEEEKRMNTDLPGCEKIAEEIRN